jgi:iron complex transport system ATP-binding protein
MVEPLLSMQGLSVGYPGARNSGSSTGSRNSLRSLKSSLKERSILADINLDLWPGELVCLLGPNGSGKSTLLRTLAGLQPALKGRVILGGETASMLSPEAWARKVAIVLTEQVDAGNMTVYALVALGRHPYTGWTGKLRSHDREAIYQGLVDAGAWDLRERIFDQLSDGEKQRVMLARALAQEPQLLILDEPTAFLDLPRRVETMRSLRRLARKRGRAVLLSTHDLDLAMRAADRLWLLPPGGPIESGLPEELALNGSFGKVFDQGDVVFDFTSGQFRIHGHPALTAFLTGDRNLAFWTGRILEREGYAINSPAENYDLRISVHVEDGKPIWDLESKQGPCRITAFKDLIPVLRQ